ncbi:SDR family oxidoreductase [Rhodobacteraceae bacterium]|nr:SDR family oxidoreductase [Paracoccaceae bacterium]
MKTLVIGSDGYVGVEICKLLRKISQVSKIDAGWFGILDPTTIVADIRDIVDSHDFSVYDSIVYLAAVSNDPMGNSFSKLTHIINHETAIQVAKLSKSQGVRKFIFASSCSAYGAGGNSARQEIDTLNPLTDYAHSKVNAEADLYKIADENFNIYCLRFATACGSSDNLRLDLVVNDFVASAITEKKIKVLSNGEPFRPLISVKDMGRAINGVVLSNQRSDRVYNVYNVGSNEFTFRIRDLAHSVASHLSFTPDVEINYAAALDSRSYKVDFEKFTKDFPKFTPTQNLSEVVNELERQITKLVSMKGLDYKTWIPHNRLTALKLFFG